VNSGPCEPPNNRMQQAVGAIMTGSAPPAADAERSPDHKVDQVSR
jgi:hypothetical protein